MRKKILVVDNNPVILRLMLNLLEGQEGHEVKTASDGLAALDLLQEFIPDCVFLDMIMPKIGGAKLCRLIRSSPLLKHIQVVILSGIAAEETINYQEFGADACIAKGPFASTSRHILDVLAGFDQARGQEVTPRIYGLNEVFHRQSTSELLLSNRHFETILANISDGILECTVDAKIVYANPLAATLFCQSGETDLLSTTLYDHFHPQDRERVVRLLAASTASPQTIGEQDPLLLHDRLLSLTSVEVVEAKERFILILLRDITALKRSEEELRHSSLSQAAIGELLQLSLVEVTLAEILEGFIAKITSLSWLGLEASGVVFLAGHDPHTLQLRAHCGLVPSMVDSCQRITVGHCLCGQAAAEAEVKFSGASEGQAIPCHAGMATLSRYCVPIIADGCRLLGVFAVFLKAGCTREPRVEQTLVAASRVLAGIIERLLAGQRLKESEQDYRAFAQIGLELSVEKDIDRLLEMIVDEARYLSKADAGTLYLVDAEGTHLRFAVLQNDTMHTRMRGTDPGAAFPSVPLFVDGRPNHGNVASHVALSGEIVNISDVYQAQGFDFTGPRRYDAATGYRSQSMLVIPVKNHVNEVIGVLQLLNAQDRNSGEVIAFPDDFVDLVASLASQAAMALTNIQLVKEQHDLFYAFMKSIATAIDEKSPYTGGHIRRVYDLTMMIAEKINETDDDPFGQVRFNEDELEELRLAAWMHDVGKITTPDHVVDKADKLETIFSRFWLVQSRFGTIAQLTENEILRRKLALFSAGQADPEAVGALDGELAKRLAKLEEDLAFIGECNKASEFMSDDKIARVKAIAARRYVVNGQEHPFLEEDEVLNLCIRKGNLNEEERKIIENHASMTHKILMQLPFPKNLARVPDYACGHHEKLDGSGYPRGLAGENLPLQARIMAIADIFEALTARDRPYRKPMPLSQAIKIMGFMKQDRHIDPSVFDLFLASGLFRMYAEKEMNPEQIDV